MQNARAASNLSRIAGRAAFGGPPLSVFQPASCGLFLFFGCIFRNLEQSFHASSNYGGFRFYGRKNLDPEQVAIA
jgi:hypothetical protein